MPFGSSAMNYAKKFINDVSTVSNSFAQTYASRGGLKAAAKTYHSSAGEIFGKQGRASLYGMAGMSAVGGMYGAVSSDSGMANTYFGSLGGSLTGAVAGAAMGRYGFAGLNRGAKLGIKGARNARHTNAARREFARYGATSFAKGAYRQASADARQAGAYIGNTLTSAKGQIRGFTRGMTPMM